MAITYPLSLPATPNFSEFNLRKVSVVGETMSPFTGDQQTQVHDGQWWEADITLPAMLQATAAAWEAFFAKLNGVEGTLLLGDPVRATPNGTAASSPGTPTIDGAHSARVNELGITGGGLTQTGWLLAGDMIQVGTGSSSRLYMNLDDVNTDGAGATTLTVWPKTRAALSGGETVTVSSPKGLFRLKSNMSDFGRVPVFTRVSQFTVKEAI